MMNYITRINRILIPSKSPKYSALDLFAGCGGLALGFESSGFETLGFDSNEDCCETYNNNLTGNCTRIELTPDTRLPNADIVIGGPPCQPFSVGGNQKGLNDSRDGFPTFISVIRKKMPPIWMFENVRGMLYRNRNYLDEILDTLKSLGYAVDFRLLNAVDFGVPQNRERLIVVGSKIKFQFPQPLTNCFTARDALKDILYKSSPDSRYLTKSMDQYVAKYEKASHCRNPRDLRLDRPARTLTCRNLAGATGDMHRVLLPDGRRRRMLIREAARLQSFPDKFSFVGGETSRFNQIGNAVSPMFGYEIAQSMYEALEKGRRLTAAEKRNINEPPQLELQFGT